MYCFNGPAADVCRPTPRPRRWSRFIQWIWILCIQWVLFSQLSASHFLGEDIRITWLQGDDYRITRAVYRDCRGIAFNSPFVGTLLRLYNNTPQLVFFNRISISDITPLCPGQISPCPNSTTAFGLEEHLLQADVTGLSPNEPYRFQVTNSARNLSITTGAANQTMFVYVNFRTGLQNSSPVFLNRPVAAFCVNQPAVFSPTGYDPDGDAIVYSLQTCYANSTTPANYYPGYSPAHPLSSSTPIVLNPNTGAISFTPSLPGEVAIICLRADEYRNGALIGSVVRDMQVIVTNCSNATPIISSPGNVVVQPGQTYCASLSATDADGDPITLSAVGGILPPASFVQTSSLPGAATGTFCFTPNLGHAGNTYTVTVNAMDGSCPSPGIGVATFNLTVPATCGMTVTAHQTSPCNALLANVSSTVTGGEPPYAYSWTGPSGYASFDSNPHDLQPGTYLLTVVDGASCVATTSITVGNGATSMEVTPVIGDADCDQDNGTIELAITGGSAPYLASLDSGGFQGSTLFTGLAVGTYSFVVQDANGCSISGFAAVDLQPDAIPPVLLCPASQVIPTESGLCGATVTYASASATDNCSSVNLQQTSGPAPGSFLPTGQHVVEFTGTDASGNTGTCTFALSVEDHEPPTQQCGLNSNSGPAIAALANEPGQCSATFAFLNSVSDNCAGATVAQVAGLPSGSMYPVGATLNSFVATDAAGNTSLCSFQVIVSDAEAPVALCQDVTLHLDGSGLATLLPASPDAGSTDNCGSILRTVAVTEFTCADLGTHPASLLITDTNGNSSTCGFQVTVVDSVAPVAICQNVTLSVPGAGLSLGASLLNGGTSDACGIATLSVTPSLFSCGSLGVQSVILTATDASGNSSTCASQVSLQAEPIVVQISSPLNTCGFHVTSCCGSPYGSGGSGSDGSGSEGSGSGGSGSGSGGEGHHGSHGSGSGHRRSGHVVVHGGGHGHGGCGGGNLGGGSCGRDGRISTTVSGGCGALTYVWSNGATVAQLSGLTAGLYTVTVTDANGNSGTGSIVLTQASAASVAISGQNVTCFGQRNGSLTAQGQGGCPAYTYRWSNGATTASISGLGAGNYTVTVTDGYGCTVTATRAITQPSRLLADAGANQVVYPAYAPRACASLNGAASGGTGPYSYSWINPSGQTVSASQVATVCPTATSVYRLRVQDMSGCLAVDSLAVCPRDIGCGLNMVQICHSVAGRFGHSQTQCIPTSQVAQHLDHGDMLGRCGRTANCAFPRSSGAGNGGGNHKMGDESSEGGAVLNGLAYPNPTSALLTLELDCGDCQPSDRGGVVVTDMLGHDMLFSVTDFRQGGMVATLDLSALPAGIYQVTVYFNGHFWKERILKR